MGSRHPGAKRWNPASGAHAFNLRAANMGLMSLSRLLVLRTGNESGSQVERLILPPFSPPPAPVSSAAGEETRRPGGWCPGEEAACPHTPRSALGLSWAGSHLPFLARPWPITNSCLAREKDLQTLGRAGVQLEGTGHGGGGWEQLGWLGWHDRPGGSWPARHSGRLWAWRMRGLWSEPALGSLGPSVASSTQQLILELGRRASDTGEVCLLGNIL